MASFFNAIWGWSRMPAAVPTPDAAPNNVAEDGQQDVDNPDIAPDNAQEAGPQDGPNIDPINAPENVREDAPGDLANAGAQDQPDLPVLTNAAEGPRQGNQVSTRRQRQWERIETNHPSTMPRESGKPNREVKFARDCPRFVPFETNDINDMNGRWTADGFDRKFAVDQACALIYLIHHQISNVNITRLLNNIGRGTLKFEMEAKKTRAKAQMATRHPYRLHSPIGEKPAQRGPRFFHDGYLLDATPGAKAVDPVQVV